MDRYDGSSDDPVWPTLKADDFDIGEADPSLLPGKVTLAMSWDSSFAPTNSLGEAEIWRSASSTLARRIPALCQVKLLWQQVEIVGGGTRC
jgi:hypothetical protein